MSEAKEAQAYKPLSKALKIFYGVGDCGFSIMTNIESYYFNFFLTNLAKFSLPMVTMITTVASTVDACLSWMYGAILNSIKPKKWGRYRSWLILITWLVPIIYAFQFIKVGDGGGLSAFIIIAAAILSHIAWNFPYVANVSMIAVAGKTPEDRAQLAATRAAWGNLSKVVFAYIGPPLAAFFAAKLSEVNQYGATAFVLGVLMFVLYCCHFKMFEGYEDVETETVTKKDSARTSGGDLLRALFQNPPLIILILSDLAKWMFNFVCMGSAVYYFKYVVNDPGKQQTYILIANILCVIGSYLFKEIAKKIPTRTIVIVTYFIMAIVMFIARMMHTNMWMVIILMSIAQFGYGICYAATPALYADTVIYSEWKTGKNAAGWISGLQNVPLKVSIMTRGIIINACLAAGGFNADIDPAAASDLLKGSISNAFITVPAIALVIGGLLILFAFKLTKDKVEKYTAEIAERKAAK